MKREDLRSRIIPTIIKNVDHILVTVDKKFNTTDLIYLDCIDRQFNRINTDKDRRISATDYAQMNFAEVYEGITTRTGRQTTTVWLRDADIGNGVCCINPYGRWQKRLSPDRRIGIVPSFHYRLPSDISTQNESGLSEQQKNIDRSVDLEQLDIREVKDTEGRVIYHTLQIGEYPKTKVDEDLSRTLESLYNGGRIQEGLLCTGRWYSSNGQKKDDKDYAGKHSPEFEYQGNRYVRVVSYPIHEEMMRYSDGTTYGIPGTIKWVKVEPISYVIRNWNKMPISINPKGNGEARAFDLRAEEAVLSNIPFYPSREENGILWQNSSIRGFLNGIDVRNIRIKW